MFRRKFHTPQSVSTKIPFPASGSEICAKPRSGSEICVKPRSGSEICVKPRRARQTGYGSPTPGSEASVEPRRAHDRRATVRIRRGVKLPSNRAVHDGRATVRLRRGVKLPSNVRRTPTAEPENEVRSGLRRPRASFFSHGSDKPLHFQSIRYQKVRADAPERGAAIVTMHAGRGLPPAATPSPTVNHDDSQQPQRQRVDRGRLGSMACVCNRAIAWRAMKGTTSRVRGWCPSSKQGAMKGVHAGAPAACVRDAPPRSRRGACVVRAEHRRSWHATGCSAATTEATARHSSRAPVGACCAVRAWTCLLL